MRAVGCLALFGAFLASPLSASALVMSAAIPSKTGTGTKVCVTGANGYVAAELIKQLLSKGYHVHGTVRSLANKSKYAFLERMAAEAQAPLELFEADLEVPGSFDAAVEGCTYVFHVASPVIYNTTDPERDLVRPAVAGVSNMLETVARVQKQPQSPFKRLVLTSTTGAIFGMGQKPKNGRVFTEDEWNDVSTIDNFPYFYSKVVAERRGWELARANSVDMVTVHPAYVWGPPAAPELAGTLNLKRLAGILSGEQAGWPFDFPVCDTRDIAAVQIRAAETPGAKSRYIVSWPRTMSPKWFCDTMAARFPGKFAKMQKMDDAVQSKELIDPSRTERDLGLKLTHPDQTIVDTVTALLEGGHVEG